MMRGSLGLLGLLLLAMLALLAGCGSGAADSTATGLCTPVTDDLMPPAGATLKFMDACTLGNDAECETNLCFNFPSRGPHCSAPCGDPCECPAPSRGCSNMGVCKSP